MRYATLALILLVPLVVRAEGDAAATDAEAEAALAAFDAAFKGTKDVGEKQNAVYGLHDVRHDSVIKRLERLLKDRSPEVRNVAALALGGQRHNVAAAGNALLKSWDKDYKEDEVLSSVIDAMAELNYLLYWPKAKKTLDEDRSVIVIRLLALFGANKDWRTLPDLLDIYKKALPKGASWSTGVVNVDTGAAGDVDQKAAEAKFNAKYGQGGSKARAAAMGKRGGDQKSLATQLRNSVKSITGEDFDTSIDFEDWYVKNYVLVQRKIAEMEGRDAAAAEAKAKSELPGLQQKVDEERKKLEEKAAADRKNRGEGGDK